MGRASTIKTNFTAGEISPRLKARVDLTRYANGAKTLYNFYSLVHGGARSRQGLRYIAGAKNHDKFARLAPFVFKRSQAFILEFGDLYIRFYTSSGQVMSGLSPYEIATPWDELDLSLLKYVQARDTMFLAHPDFPMRKLVRYANTSWKLSEADWEVPPSEEIGERPSAAATLSALSGAAVTFDTGAVDVFRAGDVGRFIEAASGVGRITVFTDPQTVTIEVDAADAFAALNLASGAWKITESPKVAITPSVAGPVGAAINLTAASSAWKNFAQNTHLGSYVEINDGLVEITGFTSDTIVAGIVRVALDGTTAAPSESWALRQVQWNAVDGYPQSVGLYQQRLIVGGSPNYPNVVWGSRVGEYYNFAEGTGDSDGFAFPLASDQMDAIEHIVATKALFPLTEGSEWAMFGGIEKPLAPLNVQANPDTAYGADIARPVRIGDDVVFVQGGARKVRALAFRAELDKFSAPDISLLAEHVTEGGIVEMAYAQNPDQVLWLVRDDGLLVSMSIDRDQEVVGFGRHETEGAFESVATIPNGDTSQVWVIVMRVINGVTKRFIERFEEGLETDSCVTGAVDANTVTGAAWLAGVLTITRAAHGYATGDTILLAGFEAANDGEVPVIDDEYEITVTGANTYTVALATDPGVISTLGTDSRAETTWGGFDHLIGETLTIVTDGYVASPKTVNGAGEITLEMPAYEIEGGKAYTGLIETLPPEVPTATGTAQGAALSIHEIVVRFHKTKGGKVNGQPLPARRFSSGSVLNQPVPEFTGDKKVENLGWGRTGSGDSDGSITIERDQPLPMQVLGVIAKVTVNDG